MSTNTQNRGNNELHLEWMPMELQKVEEHMHPF